MLINIAILITTETGNMLLLGIKKAISEIKLNLYFWDADIIKAKDKFLK